jgi:hypothetical protein
LPVLASLAQAGISPDFGITRSRCPLSAPTRTAGTGCCGAILCRGSKGPGRYRRNISPIRSVLVFNENGRT